MANALSQAQATPVRAAILAVDDIPANLIALEALVGPLGHELVLASSGAQALELAASREFVAILLDVMMPEMDGLQTLERLKRMPLAKNTPVVLLTARSDDPDTLRRGYALGAIDFVAKPIDADVLRGKLGAFIALYQQGLEIRRQSEALLAKDRHLGVLAHDIRNPLAVITMGAARLEDHADPAVRTTAARMARSVKRMQSLTDDLLEYARMAAGRISIKPVPMDLAVLCSELLDDLKEAHPQVAFHLDMPASVLGVWDRERLQQALSNLLTNAIKYGDGEVNVRLVDVDQRIAITVENAAAPIDGEQMELLFAPFTQGKHRHTGVGLGLYIVREIAHAHGGDARGSWADGRVGFTLSLSTTTPAQREHTSDPDAALTNTLVRVKSDEPAEASQVGSISGLVAG